MYRWGCVEEEEEEEEEDKSQIEALQSLRLIL